MRHQGCRRSGHGCASRRWGESDIYLFAGITGDLGPNHVNAEYMRATPYGRIVAAHGALLDGFMSACSTLQYLRCRGWTTPRSSPAFGSGACSRPLRCSYNSPGGWRRGEMTRIEATAWRPPARLWVDASTVPAVDKTGLTNQAAGAGPAHPPPGLSARGCKRSPSALLAARALCSARERGYPPARCATLPAWPGGRRLRPGGGRSGSPLARELARPGAPAPHQKSGDGAAGERGARPRPRRGGPAPARQLRLACGRRCATGGVCSRRRRSSLPGRGRTR